MEHNELTHQHRPLWMVKRGLFYCICKKCGENTIALSENIFVDGYFYYTKNDCVDGVPCTMKKPD